ncbi:FucTA [Bugula neritina]|uniref:Fucosyltransferase n=1 Tax=Bugula neritina TaxID=10212 RepID=A0A7J7KDS2_BUGNE|nr:FucTA [Bugula neritina]
MWMDINQESPVYTHADEEILPLQNRFNLSSNYFLNSDYSISYIPTVRLKNSSKSLKSINYSAGKTKMALWFVSHCQAASGRDEYVKELQKYISVDIFGMGNCSGKSDGCAPGNTTCYNELRSKYKFYLAFENSICKEYITEKFWNTLTSGSYNIPIALGASVEEYKWFAPPNSFLHTRNFTSIRLLAEFMHKLDKDSSAYNSYHRWRESHEIVPRYHEESLQCYMCRQAHLKQDGKAEYKNISKYWSRKNNCDLKPEPIR